MKDLLAFLDASPSAFNAIKGFEATLSKNGFEKLKESEDYVLKGGKSYYVIRNSSSILAFKVPLDLKESSFKITASHSDCPALKLKPGSLIKENGYVITGPPLEYYLMDISNTFSEEQYLTKIHFPVERQ